MAVLDNAPDDVRTQLDAAAAERGCGTALDLIKRDMKEERDQHETIEGWLAALPGRLSNAGLRPMTPRQDHEGDPGEGGIDGRGGNEKRLRRR